MINHRPPETTIQAMNKASKTIDELATLDRNFPDIGDTLKASSSRVYATTEESAVQPIISKATFTMPVQALEQIQQRKLTDAAGLFSEINRAYFVVKNQLYFWNYNDRQDFNVYEDTHDIVNVAIAKPKPDIFNKEVTHVLIVASTHEINVIALSYKCQDNFVDTLTFYKTGIMTSSVGVRMTTILATNIGRIFMSGDDGNVWELIYKREEGWFTSRCYKTIHSGDYKHFFFNQTSDPTVSIAISNDGKVLYQLTQKSNIKVAYLGKDGQGFTSIPIHTSIEETAKLLCPDSPLISSTGFKITSIHPTLLTEAKKYQLIAITSTGCRLYLSHYKTDSPIISHEDPPNGLDLIHVRLPPPTPQLSTILSTPRNLSTPTNPSFQQSNITTTTTTTPATTLPLVSPQQSFQISKCLYNNGVLMMVYSNDNTEILTTCCPDMGYLAKDVRSELHEMYNSQSLPGKIITITEITKSPFQLNELASSTSLGSTRQFLAFTTTGLTLLLKQRPVDMLQNLLLSSGSDIRHRAADFKEFYDFFGHIQSSSLCFGLIGRADSTIASGTDLFSNISPSTDIAKGASDLLDKYGLQPSSLKPQYSSRHDGLALYIYRLIRPIWTVSIVKETASPSSQIQYQSTVERGTLLIIQQVLRKLQGYMDLKIVMQMNPHSPEELSTQELYELVKLLAEAISFFICLFDSDFTGIMEKFKPEVRTKVMAMTYKDLLTTSEGRLMHNDLTRALTDQHLL
ncbi:Nup133 N terminal like-domain-containing protein [Halteromyces radiatus]|uniref:Nup133 N terminal like-domain-containing protein n=1 Tax=Halteromyces radiatus TaxID=101107 RepID=UPI00221FE57A|nr:Nup133 N terminal like-domain-containing protein [Halteromyces radiatus]KAI8081329.1 Nup133 N terminal like-domain-containing protein [Halteromyces radiatus]